MPNPACFRPRTTYDSSAPFDKRILQAISGARLNILHLHVEPSHIDLFRDFPATAINYSVHVSSIPVADVRRRYGNVIMGGIDEVNYRKLTVAEIKAQWRSAGRRREIHTIPRLF